MPRETSPAASRFHRIGSETAGTVDIFVDGEPVRAWPGETLLVAVLTTRSALRRSDAAAEMRAGFCLMGACQDCWLWREDGHRLRACTSPVEAGMRVWSKPPPGWPQPMVTVGS